ncbi:NAD(P)-dependent oxidoreductase [Streptomyces sp. GC420]|uniref:NAD(P)-dependent oxidoreductase n=1 Tax=Streptomyces sp. GC420 TaxID=2697568 RepID=UPI001414D090|nr:SDR family oxidoreductase [Streptomyces sp. GC420]NBM19334.1 NAD(P)H-binding protein [Streptomyces sp. GC420]
MDLTVFGATGGVGREIVRQALTAGHRVTAVVRDPARLPVTGERLQVVTAGLGDPGPLRQAVAGRDAVLSGVGPSGPRAAGIAASATRSILGAMEAEGVRRFVAVSAAPLGPVPENETVLLRLLTPVVSRVLRKVYDDLREMEDEMRRSAAEWTAVRPPRLTDAPLTGVYRRAVDANPRGGRRIGRADVAHAMLAAVDDPATVGRALGIAY